MDPELKAYLEAIEQRIDRRFAETHKTMDGLRDEIAEVRRQAGMDRDAIIAEIKALPEAFSTHQRAEADRLDAAREEDMLNHHVLPLEASAASHERRLNDHEKRIRAVEKR